MIDYKIIKDYYKSDAFNPYLPKNPGWYHYRVIDNKGLMVKIPVKITSKEKLRKWLLKLNATDVYFSSSYWLNPEKIGLKGLSGSYRVAHNHLLRFNLYFDTDAKPWCWENLDKTRADIIKVYDKCIAHGWENEYVAFSGCQGFLASFTRNDKLPNILPPEIIKLTEENRKIYIDKEFKGINIDVPVSKNVMGIRRLPGTIHSKTGFICTQISPSILYNDIKTILNQCPYVTKNRPGIPSLKENDEKSHLELTALSDGTGPTSKGKDTYFEQAITNNVMGTKNLFVPLFEYMSEQEYIKDLKRLQKKYNVGPLYIYKHCSKEKDMIYALGIKTFQKRRLEKIYTQSHARNKNYFKRFGRCLLTFPLDQGHFGAVYSLYQKPKGNISKAHLNFNSKFFNIDEKEKIIGNEKVKMIKLERGR